jgi:hypothetical protein
LKDELTRKEWIGSPGFSFDGRPPQRFLEKNFFWLFPKDHLSDKIKVRYGS